MTKTIDKSKKFKAAGLAALIIGGAAIAGIVYNKHTKSYDVQFKKESSHMSAKQLENAIKESDDVLARLQNVIDSDETDPEERFNARQVYKSVSEERAGWVKRLEQIKSRRGKTIHLYDVEKAR